MAKKRQDEDVPILVKVTDYGSEGITPHEDHRHRCPHRAETACVSGSGGSICGRYSGVEEIGHDKYVICTDIGIFVSGEQMDEIIAEIDKDRWRKPALIKIECCRELNIWAPIEEDRWMCPYNGEKVCSHEGGGGIQCGCFQGAIRIAGQDYAMCRDAQVDYVPRTE